MTSCYCFVFLNCLLVIAFNYYSSFLCYFSVLFFQKKPLFNSITNLIRNKRTQFKYSRERPPPHVRVCRWQFTLLMTYVRQNTSTRTATKKFGNNFFFDQLLKKLSKFYDICGHGKGFFGNVFSADV